MKDQYKGREDCLKREALTVFRFKGGLGMKEEGDVFDGGGGGVDTQMHTMPMQPNFVDTLHVMGCPPLAIPYI